MRVTGHCGFGIKKRSWFGGRSRLLSVRPPFMEPVVGGPLGVPSPHDGYERPLRMSSSFPLKDDAGYIGYLTDDDERVGSGGSGGDDIISVVHRRRRELLGPDISFTMCCLLVLMVMMVMMLMVMMVWWGYRPPTAGNFVR
jgi:hypothetical protein